MTLQALWRNNRAITCVLGSEQLSKNKCGQAHYDAIEKLSMTPLKSSVWRRWKAQYDAVEKLTMTP